jgi:hypothetical protein
MFGTFTSSGNDAEDQSPSRRSRRRHQADPPAHVIRHDYDDDDAEEEWDCDDNLDIVQQPEQRTTKPLSNNTAALGPEYKDQVRSVAVARRIPLVAVAGAALPMAERKIESRSILQSCWDAVPSDREMCLFYGSMGLLALIAIALLTLLAAGVIFN